MSGGMVQLDQSKVYALMPGGRRENISNRNITKKSARMVLRRVWCRITASAFRNASARRRSQPPTDSSATPKYLLRIHRWQYHHVANVASCGVRDNNTVMRSMSAILQALPVLTQSSIAFTAVALPAELNDFRELVCNAPRPTRCREAAVREERPT
jgi:hypothetical protein